MLQLIHYTVTNILYTCPDTVVLISFGTIRRNVTVLYFINVNVILINYLDLHNAQNTDDGTSQSQQTEH